MRRFLALVFASLLVFVCFAPSFSADFVEYPTQNPENPYAPAPVIFDVPSLLSYYYYPDQTSRPDLYVYGGSYWGLTNTSSWEHSEHAGRDYVSWVTYRVNYQLFLNDGTESNTPWKMSKVGLQVAAPMAGTQVRVSGFSENINLAVQGVLDGNSKLSMDVYPVDTLFIPQDSNTRFSFWVDFTVMFDPSVDIEELVNLSASQSPVFPIMDAAGFAPRLVSYIPADSMGGSSAAGQQQIDESINTQGDKVDESINTQGDKVDESINTQGDKIDQSVNQQTQQQEQQYNEFTESGDSSLFDDTFDSVEGKIGLFTALTDILMLFWNSLIDFSPSGGYPVLTFPSFTLTVDGIDYTVWPDIDVNLGFIPEYFPVLYDYMLIMNIIVVYVLLVRYLIRVWERIMGNEYIRGGDYF